MTGSTASTAPLERYPPEFLDDLRQRTPVSGVVGRHVRLIRAGREFKGLCPFHREKTPSFTVNDAKGFYKCFGCGAHGDVFDFLVETQGMTFPAAVESLAGGILPKPRQAEGPAAGASQAPNGLRWSAVAEDRWRRGLPIAGSLAEIYLKIRCGVPPAGGDLRFVPPGSGSRWPAMLAKVTDALTGAPLTLHTTFLALDGTSKAPIERPKLLLAGHVKAGGVIRLTVDAEVGHGLGLAEGIETAGAVMAGGWSPVWAAIDAGNMAAFPTLPGILSLTLFADNDASGVGQAAARKCADRWIAAGREAAVVIAPEVGTDWADALKAAA